MKRLICIFLLPVLFSCGAPVAVYDYDQNVTFQNFKTYAYFPDLQSGLSQLDEGRLKSSLSKALQMEGLMAAEDPDIYINIYIEEYQQSSRNTLGVGVGGSGRNVGVGVSGGIPLGGPDTYLKLTFDFIEVANDALIWQAIVEDRFNLNANPEQRGVWFDKVVKKALEGYPPK